MLSNSIRVRGSLHTSLPPLVHQLRMWWCTPPKLKKHDFYKHLPYNGKDWYNDIPQEYTALFGPSCSVWSRYSWAMEGDSLKRFFLNMLVYVYIYMHRSWTFFESSIYVYIGNYIYIYIYGAFKKVQLLCTLLHAHHYKSSPYSHHWIEPFYSFALPHLPFKRLSFINLESLHLSYFSCLWKEGQEEKTSVSDVLPCSEVQCLWPSFLVIGRFHCELKSQRSCHVPARHL